jgi:hypothetical protein
MERLKKLIIYISTASVRVIERKMLDNLKITNTHLNLIIKELKLEMFGSGILHKSDMGDLGTRSKNSKRLWFWA